MNRLPLQGSMTLIAMLELMAEDSLDAARILGEITGFTDMTAMMRIADLDDMGIRGLQIVSAYEYCGKNIRKFMEAVSDRDPDMVQAVNAPTNRYPAGMPRAYTNGAARRNTEDGTRRQFASRAEERRYSANKGSGFIRGARVRK